MLTNRDTGKLFLKWEPVLQSLNVRTIYFVTSEANCSGSVSVKVLIHPGHGKTKMKEGELDLVGFLKTFHQSSVLNDWYAVGIILGTSVVIAHLKTVSVLFVMSIMAASSFVTEDDPFLRLRFKQQVIICGRR